MPVLGVLDLSGVSLVSDRELARATTCKAKVSTCVKFHVGVSRVHKP